MEGFNDVWANILNDKILAELTNLDPVPKVDLNPPGSANNELLGEMS